jgi:hypothetical protein
MWSEVMSVGLAPGEPVVWESFSWRSGAETYRFEVQDRGLIGRLAISDGRGFALPMIVWEAMLDAIKTSRKAKLKSEENLPPRAGTRWSERESDELAAKFRTGRSIDDLAREHARTSWAIREQLGKLGLWDRIGQRSLV